jgi:hypothetical protein
MAANRNNRHQRNERNDSIGGIESSQRGNSVINNGEIISQAKDYRRGVGGGIGVKSAAGEEIIEHRKSAMKMKSRHQPAAK